MHMHFKSEHKAHDLQFGCLSDLGQKSAQPDSNFYKLNGSKEFRLNKYSNNLCTAGHVAIMSIEEMGLTDWKLIIIRINSKLNTNHS